MQNLWNTWRGKGQIVRNGNELDLWWIKSAASEGNRNFKKGQVRERAWETYAFIMHVIYVRRRRFRRSGIPQFSFYNKLIKYVVSICLLSFILVIIIVVVDVVLSFWGLRSSAAIVISFQRSFWRMLRQQLKNFPLCYVTHLYFCSLA